MSKRYKVHDPENAYKGKVGEVVVIGETRPVSKDKRWKIV
jgi:small subunit ribosomal protein S17